MKDLIERQAAIDFIDTGHLCNPNEPRWSDNEIVNFLKSIPSAQSERKKGRWIRNDNGTYSCSVCQSWIPEEQHYYARYCLYCGTDMRSENNE